jgi:hypothetical protein
MPWRRTALARRSGWLSVQLVEQRDLRRVDLLPRDVEGKPGLEKFGGPDSLVCADLPEPEPMAGHVVIEIKALLQTPRPVGSTSSRPGSSASTRSMRPTA